MKKTVLIRKVTNMSQRDLANLLGVPGSVVAMYEKGDRDLPLNALVKLANLEIAWDKNPPAAQEGDMCVNVSHPFFMPVSIAGKLQQHVQEFKNAIDKLKEELFYMRTSHEMYQCWTTVLLGSRREEKQGRDAGPELWLEIYMPKLTARIDLVGPEKQFMLQYRIDSKLALLAVAEQALERLSAGISPQET